MRNFQLIAQGIDVVPIMNQLTRQPDIWNQDRFRTTFPNSPHTDCDDVLLRFSDTSKCSTRTHVIGDNEPIWLPAIDRLPAIKPVVLDLMRRAEGFELGRLIISRLKPGGRILEHRDADGEYVQSPNRARYHIPLQGLPGSLYHCGGETVQMLTGSCWWFNAHELHSVENNSADDRIHLMVDMTLWL